MPNKIDELIAELIEREGGYVNHPLDKGGPTKYGITEASLKACSPNGLVPSVKDLTKQEAATIYKLVYYYDTRTDRFPEELQDLMLDMNVLHGASNAIKILQRALNDLGGSLKSDGVLGPKTLQALDFADPIKLRKAINQKRRTFIEAIIKKHPEQKIFKHGWLNRINSFDKEI